MEITSVNIKVPPETNLIPVQAHFIKTVEVIITLTGHGGAIPDMVDGVSPAGIETGKDVEVRKKFLRTIGYKR
jgi:adenosine/AMP kinase